jgi:hypothetical protein
MFSAKQNTHFVADCAVSVTSNAQGFCSAKTPHHLLPPPVGKRYLFSDGGKGFPEGTTKINESFLRYRSGKRSTRRHAVSRRIAIVLIANYEVSFSIHPGTVPLPDTE